MDSIRSFFDGILDVITSFFVKILYFFNRYTIPSIPERTASCHVLSRQEPARCFFMDILWEYFSWA